MDTIGLIVIVMAILSFFGLRLLNAHGYDTSRPEARVVSAHEARAKRLR